MQMIGGVEVGPPAGTAFRPMGNRTMSNVLARVMTSIAGTIVLGAGIAHSATADRLDQYMYARMQKAGVPGAQVAVIRDGTVIALRSYGLANVKPRDPVDDTTAFSIASITKAFIGVAAMQLVEQGRLALSAPVARYVDNLPPAWRAVTIRQLLTNVSGLPDLWERYDVIAQDESEAWSKVTTRPMLARPGERFQYTQTNYVLLARIITRLSGMPFTDFVASNQLKSVGMRRTTFAYPSDHFSHTAGRYTFYDTTGPEIRRTDELRERAEDNPKWFAACNGMMSTASDLAHWIIALENHGLLKQPGSLATLWTPGVLSDGTQSPGFGYFLNGYALGWETATRLQHRAVAATGGERSALFIYPNDNLAIVVLTNLMGSEPEGWIDGIAALYFSPKPAR